MEIFERIDIDTYLGKPTRWKRFVDDTNIIWPHGKE